MKQHAVDAMRDHFDDREREIGAPFAQAGQRRFDFAPGEFGIDDESFDAFKTFDGGRLDRPGIDRAIHHDFRQHG